MNSAVGQNLVVELRWDRHETAIAHPSGDTDNPLALVSVKHPLVFGQEFGFDQACFNVTRFLEIGLEGCRCRACS